MNYLKTLALIVTVTTTLSMKAQVNDGKSIEKTYPENPAEFAMKCSPWQPTLYFNENEIKAHHIEKDQGLNLEEEELLQVYLLILKEYPALTATFTGYRESEENKAISFKRAKRFVKKLRKLGVDKNRLAIVDGGIFVFEKKPLEPMMSAEDQGKESRKMLWTVR